MIHVQMPDDYEMPGLSKTLERAAQAALAHQKTEGELSVQLGDDQLLHQLNNQHLGEDHPTDVLSFPSGEADPETGQTYLGDIAISVERARSQAEAAGHRMDEELQLLVVHGVLHLLGHDHANIDEKGAMWAAQAAILESLEVRIAPDAFEG
ncbi:MAG: rRNA maturation RNase YbeY [Chloroflexi bacterium]|nr:rRNA maturation RNase YbeY [Chloroflexota bacterium]